MRVQNKLPIMTAEQFERRVRVWHEAHHYAAIPMWLEEDARQHRQETAKLRAALMVAIQAFDDICEAIGEEHGEWPVATCPSCLLSHRSWTMRDQLKAVIA